MGDSTLLKEKRSITEEQKYVLRSLVSSFMNLPDEDDPQTVKLLIGLLNGLLRVKEYTPPTVEIMTILKFQKPTLYHATKRCISSSSHLTLLFELESSLDLVQERLHQLIEV